MAEDGRTAQANAPAEAGGRPATKEIPGEWRFRYPNQADFNFNYWTLLARAKASGTAIAQAPAARDKLRIAVVGAGVAGLTAARELLRCGYKNIDIFEATDRIGGRVYSIPSPDGLTTFEMGAMRLPFFWPYDKDGEREGKRCGSRNCVLDYYCDEFSILTQEFPNPGAEGFTTGIYINRGRGVEPPLSWKDRPTDLVDPTDAGLQAIKRKWDDFKKLFQDECRKRYATREWPEFWQQIVQRYDAKNFRQFVLLNAKDTYDPKVPGDFGGLGMTDNEARVFAVVGMGDGGWGAFFDISCLYVMRTALFGFFDGLQLIQGKFPNESPLADDETPVDSLDQPLSKPAFLGVQSLAECLFYDKASSSFDDTQVSLYEAVKAARTAGDRRSGVHLYTRSSVRHLEKLSEEKERRIHLVADKVNGIYDHVVVTAQPWSLQVEGGFENFEYDSELPWEVRYAMDSSHFITSCKVFYPLKERYWEEPHGLPQVIITDTFIQGVYGIAVKVKDEDRGHPGVVLVSYTWEDDAAKLVADDDAKLAQRCLEHLDTILVRCGKKPISPCLDDSAPRVHHWVRSRSYRGCARLYRQCSRAHDIALLSYNEKYSKNSGLYFAGEAYSVEGGWVEPALRSALHAVLHLVNNTGGTFLNGFNFKDHYPAYSASPA